MHIKDHSAAMKFFRTYDTAASKGKWKDFVDEMEFESMIQKPRAMAQEPRNMAQGGRIGFEDKGLVKEKRGGKKVPQQGFQKGNVWYQQNIGKYKTDKVRLRKLRQLLDNLEKGTTLSLNQLFKETGVSRPTIDSILDREYKNKFKIPGMGKAQSLNIQKLNLQKLAQPVDSPTPFPKSNLVKWPDEGIKNKYVRDLKTKYTFASGSLDAAKVSNSALAKKYFGEVNQATIARIERINSILSRDLNLTYPKADRSAGSLRRYRRVQESQKYLSATEKEILKKQTTQKKVLNKYFKNNPEKAFTNKKLKELIDVKLKNGKLDFTPRYDNPKKYVDLAKRGSLFDEFDISPIRGEKRNIQYPVNKNISPGKFNQGFIKQVDSYFKNTIGSTNFEVIANKKAIHEFLKSTGYTVEIMGEGRIGAKALPAIDTATGRLPNIENTLKQLDLPQLVPTSEVISKQKISRGTLFELLKKANIPCVKGVGGNCTTPEDFRKGFNQLVQEGAEGSKDAVSKLGKFTKAMRGLKGAAKWTGYGALAEIGFVVPFAVHDYGTGESWKRILGNATDWGFGPMLGQSEQEEFLAALPEGSKGFEAQEVERLGEQLTRLGEKKPRPTGRIGMDKKRFQESQEKFHKKVLDEFSENLDPFLSDTPWAKDQWHQGMWGQAQQDIIDARAAVAKEKLERLQERREKGIIAEEDWMAGSATRGYASGGLANLTRTVARDSGPMQGLASTPEYDTYRKEYKWQT